MGRFRRQPAVGIDIDRGAIKAVQVAPGGGGHTLQHVGYRRLPPGVVTDGEVTDHDLLASELREFWSSHSFKGKNVYLGLSNQKVVVRFLDFPHMSEDELKSAIGFEAQDHIPMPMEEAVMDYVVLGPREEGSDLDRILIVAAGREMVGRYTSAVRAAGLRPAGIDVKALSLVRSTLPQEAAAEDEGAVLLVDIGSELTNLAVTQGATPTLTRFLPGGSNFLAQSVADATDLSEDEAEQQLINARVSLGSNPPEPEEESEEDIEETGETSETAETEEILDPALRYDFRRGLEEAIQTLAEDVQRSIEYHYSQPESADISQVVVSGEGALVYGLDGYLGELLGVPVNRGRPLQRVTANKSNVSDEQLEAMGPVLAVAIGVAVEDS